MALASVSEQMLSAIISDLYGAIYEPERQVRFLQGIANATKSHFAGILVHDLEHSAGGWGTSIGVDLGTLAEYETRASAENIWMQRSTERIQVGRVLETNDIVTIAELKSTRYFQDFLRYVDVAQGLGVCVSREANHVAMLSLNASERAGNYSKQSIDFLKALAPHWVNAYTLSRELERLRLSEFAAASNKSAAVFWLDQFGGVHSHNAAAQVLLSNQMGLRMLAGKLVFSHRADHDFFSTRCAGNPSWVLNELAVRRVLHDANAHPIAHARLQSVPKSLGSVFHAHQARFMLLIEPFSVTASGELAPFLRNEFGLIPSEARLACALIDHTHLSLAAQSLNITLNTARTQLKQIFAKTGRHDQTSLLLMLTALAAA